MAPSQPTKPTSRARSTKSRSGCVTNASGIKSASKVFRDPKKIKLIQKIFRGEDKPIEYFFRSVDEPKYYHGKETYDHAQPFQHLDGTDIDLHELPPIKWINYADASYLKCAPDDLDPHTTHLKHPSFSSYKPGDNTYSLVSFWFAEMESGEKLSDKPHPNVAEYYGAYKEPNGDFTGTYWRKYKETLGQRFGGGKAAFDTGKAARQMRSAINHLHKKIGVVHGDIKPDNFMVDERDNVVLIDFDSSATHGEQLPLKRGTRGWYEDGHEMADKQYDLDALNRTITWMTEFAPRRRGPTRAAKKQVDYRDTKPRAKARRERKNAMRAAGSIAGQGPNYHYDTLSH